VNISVKLVSIGGYKRQRATTTLRLCDDTVTFLSFHAVVVLFII
jgi:hypothetical protein